MVYTKLFQEVLLLPYHEMQQLLYLPRICQKLHFLIVAQRRSAPNFYRTKLFIKRQNITDYPCSCELFVPLQLMLYMDMFPQDGKISFTVLIYFYLKNALRRHLTLKLRFFNCFGSFINVKYQEIRFELHWMFYIKNTPQIDLWNRLTVLIMEFQ